MGDVCGVITPFVVVSVIDVVTESVTVFSVFSLTEKTGCFAENIASKGSSLYDEPGLVVSDISLLLVFALLAS